MMGKSLIFVMILLLSCSLSVGESLEQFLTKKVIADYQLNPEYVKVTLVRTDISAEDISGFDVKAYPLTQSDPGGRFPMRVELHLDGAIVEKGAVSLNIRIMADLLVPEQNIKRHTILDANMFVLKRFDVTSIRENMLSDARQMVDCRAKQNLTADRYVSLSRIEKIPDVENRQQVTILGSSGLFEIRAKGTALQNGYVGETIKVKNVDSRKILMGKVIAPGVIEISI
jgi:flagella basal body P-ring formation protein FlgA